MLRFPAAFDTQQLNRRKSLDIIKILEFTFKS